MEKIKYFIEDNEQALKLLVILTFFISVLYYGDSF